MSLFTLGYLARLALWAFAALTVQGGVVAASAEVCQRMAARASPELQHRLACGHFLVLLLSPLLSVFLLHASLTAGARDTVHSAPLIAAEALQAESWRPVALALGLALAWSLGVLFTGAGLVLDLGRAVLQPAEPAAPALVAEVRQLAKGWTPAPCVVQSTAVLAPEVHGVRRSVLVVPRDFDRLLPQAERDAVLLHELAHVARADFGWNLLQRVGLALFWFHPGAWMLYAHIRRAREARCDALAVSRGAHRSALARGLVRLAEGQGGARVAMAAAREGELGRRVRLLLDDRSSPTCVGLVERRAPLGGLAALVACSVSLGFAVCSSRDPMIANLYQASVFGRTVSISARDGAGPFALKVRQGRVVEAFVGERRLQPYQIVQTGEQVVLVGALRRPVLTLTVSPSDRVSWRARS